MCHTNTVSRFTKLAQTILQPDLLSPFLISPDEKPPRFGTSIFYKHKEHEKVRVPHATADLVCNGMRLVMRARTDVSPPHRILGESYRRVPRCGGEGVELNVYRPSCRVSDTAR